MRPHRKLLSLFGKPLQILILIKNIYLFTQFKASIYPLPCLFPDYHLHIHQNLPKVPSPLPTVHASSTACNSVGVRCPSSTVECRIGPLYWHCTLPLGCIDSQRLTPAGQANIYNRRGGSRRHQGSARKMSFAHYICIAVTSISHLSQQQ